MSTKPCKLPRESCLDRGYARINPHSTARIVDREGSHGGLKVHTPLKQASIQFKLAALIGVKIVEARYMLHPTRKLVKAPEIPLIFRDCLAIWQKQLVDRATGCLLACQGPLQLELRFGPGDVRTGKHVRQPVRIVPRLRFSQAQMGDEELIEPQYQRGSA